MWVVIGSTTIYHDLCHAGQGCGPGDSGRQECGVRPVGRDSCEHFEHSGEHWEHSGEQCEHLT